MKGQYKKIENSRLKHYKTPTKYDFLRKKKLWKQIVFRKSTDCKFLKIFFFSRSKAASLLHLRGPGPDLWLQARPLLRVHRRLQPPAPHLHQDQDFLLQSKKSKLQWKSLYICDRGQSTYQPLIVISIQRSNLLSIIMVMYQSNHLLLPIGSWSHFLPFHIIIGFHYTLIHFRGSIIVSKVKLQKRILRFISKISHSPVRMLVNYLPSNFIFLL